MLILGFSYRFNQLISIRKAVYDTINKFMLS